MIKATSELEKKRRKKKELAERKAVNDKIEQHESKIPSTVPQARYRTYMHKRKRTRVCVKTSSAIHTPKKKEGF